MQRYWREHPPAHLLLAAFLGFSAPASGLPDMAPEAVAGVSFDEAVSRLSAMGISIGRPVAAE